MGRYYFCRCFFRFEWHEGESGHGNEEFEMDYPEGPKDDQIGLRASYIAKALHGTLGLTMLSTVDNYFTFDVSENICIHPSVWYACNCIDGFGKERQISLKVYGIKHIGFESQQD